MIKFETMFYGSLMFCIFCLAVGGTYKYIKEANQHCVTRTVTETVNGHTTRKFEKEECIS